MYELRLSIPEPSLIAELQPEELGVKLLFLLRKRLESGAVQNGSDLPLFLTIHNWSFWVRLLVEVEGELELLGCAVAQRAMRPIAVVLHARHVLYGPTIQQWCDTQPTAFGRL